MSRRRWEESITLDLKVTTVCANIIIGILWSLDQ